MAANTPPAPKSVKKAIISKSFFENKSIVFDLRIDKIDPCFLNELLVNLSKFNTLNSNLRVVSLLLVVTHLGRK